MSLALLNALGGLGLFLFGMQAMTDGLRNLAGDRLHRWIGRVTRTPFSGAMTGALTTAVIQSSSATTVTAVGFVGAGLLTFEQSLGVIFGANIGTTVTGWIVAVLGFKVELGTFSLLLIFLAALLMLVGKGTWREAGKALAGFALLFLGLDYLKDGLEGGAGAVSLEQFSSATLSGRFMLLGVGLVLTLLTQSSSATVAATLAALGGGILDLPQALAVVIGADIGTTATAWLASLGGSTASRRTGRAHVVFNVFTGISAFLLLPFYYRLLLAFAPNVAETNAALATVGFHTAFNILGVLVVLPLTSRFAALMRRLVPERGDSPSAALEPRLAATPLAALEVLHAATAETVRRTVQLLDAGLAIPPALPPGGELDVLVAANSDCRRFVGLLAPHQRDLQDRLPALLHVCDHLERLLERCRDHRRITHLAEVPALVAQAARVRQEGRALLAWLQDPASQSPPKASLAELARRFDSDHDHVRREFIAAAVEGRRSPADLDADLDAHRWLTRCAGHLAHICSHFAASRSAGKPTPVQT